MQHFGDILGVGAPELILILLILLLLFGGRKLPGLFRSLGTSARELRDSIKDEPRGGKKS